MKQWEYKNVEAQTNAQRFENLNSLGKEGWRLILVTVDGLFIMEREIPKPPITRRNEIFDPGFSGQTPEPTTKSQDLGTELVEGLTEPRQPEPPTDVPHGMIRCPHCKKVHLLPEPPTKKPSDSGEWCEDFA